MYMGEVLDYTTYRLRKIARDCLNPEDVETILGILKDYHDGHIAIAWQHGSPVLMPLEPGAGLKGIPAGFSLVGYEPALIDDEEGGIEEDTGGGSEG